MSNEKTIKLNERNAYVTVSVDENNAVTNKIIDNSNYLTAKPIFRCRSLSPSVFTSTVSSDTLKNLKLSTASTSATAAAGTKTIVIGNVTINPGTDTLKKSASQKKTQVQVGMDRYITVLKRGRSPTSSAVASASKVPSLDRVSSQHRNSGG